MPGPPTVLEVSAGGVLYRRGEGTIEVALISVGEPPRWQLPKGLVEKGELPSSSAQREVQEETGLTGRLEGKLERIEYWYQRTDDGAKRRVHKFVHFFLFEYVSGDVADHDHEVAEARWVPLSGAAAMLAFKSERQVLGKAEEVLEKKAGAGFLEAGARTTLNPGSG